MVYLLNMVIFHGYASHNQMINTSNTIWLWKSLGINLTKKTDEKYLTLWWTNIAMENHHF